MRAGRLRHLVTIESLSEGRDAVGGVTETWSTFAQRWASITPLAGLEKYTGDERTGETTHKITMRYTSGISRKHRISYDSRLFDIVSVVNENERDRMTIIMAKERD